MITVILWLLYNQPEYRGVQRQANFSDAADAVMMDSMKLFVFLAASLVASALDLAGIKTVYLLPMANGLDQFLAIKLTTGVILQVVTDPLKADAILTDHVGAGLEQKLDDLYGQKEKPQDSTDAFAPAKPNIQPMGRARGAIFLIDRKTRNVVWSDYEHPKNTSEGELNRLAEKIAAKLAKDVKSN